MKVTESKIRKVVKGMINEQYNSGFGSGFGDLYSHRDTPVLEEGIDGIKIGEVSANIGDDYRFNQWMKVFYHREDDSVTVQLTETGAVGGSDGPGTATSRSVIGQAHLPSGVKAGKLAATVRNMISSNGDTIAQYGKPTKNFVWGRPGRSGGQNGLSVRAVKYALDWVRSK